MSQFPNLLRRSSFATHDPLITRIYTSTRSSVSKYGDWGLKYPIHRKRGPRYIRANNLDAGSAIGTDWSSGESEARFIQMWGDGRTAWTTTAQSTLGIERKDKNSFFPSTSSTAKGGGETAEEGGKAVQPLRLPAIESMSEKEFSKLLDQVRQYRSEALSAKLGRLEKEGKIAANKLSAEEGQTTMAGLAVRGHYLQNEGAAALATLTDARTNVEATRDSAPSKVLNSIKHDIGGLYYSTPGSPTLPPRYVEPSRALPGWAVQREQGTYAPSRGEQNAPLIIGVGGLLGREAGDISGRRAQDEVVLNPIDFTRTKPLHGQGQFRPIHPRIDSHPTVLNLANQALEQHYDVSSDPEIRRPPISRAKQSKPMDTFRHSISFEFIAPTAVPSEEASSTDQASTYIALGSPAYVAPPVRKLNTREDKNMMINGQSGSGSQLGGPRGHRMRGAAIHALSQMERNEERRDRDQQQTTILSLLAKTRALGEANKGEQGTRAAPRTQRHADAAGVNKKPSFREARAGRR